MMVAGRMAGQAVARREMSVRQALEWAFAAERVSIEFDELQDGPPATDTIWRLMQRGMLGCRIDGGGRSLGHDDAEVIASIVARLDVAAGGRGMAVEVARLARAGMAPDWMPGAVPRCLPREVVENRHGVFSRTVVVDEIEVLRRGRKRKVEVLACPVHFQPSAARITSARKAYGSWWLALRALQGPLRRAGLRTVEITQDLPTRAPWDTTA
jgi:hypothetical protein